MVDREHLFGADGYPLDPGHWPASDPTPFFDRKLRRLEDAYAHGNQAALAAAVKVCAKANRPLPEWVSDGVLIALSGIKRSKRGRPVNDQVDYTMWDVVRELRDRRDELADRYKPTLEAAYRNASEKLRGTEAQGEPHSIEASYKKVERIFRKGGGARFYQTGE